MRTYRASSLGYSLEALVAGHLGYEPLSPPEFLQKAFDEGHRLEPVVLDWLRQTGWMIYGEQEEVTLNVIPNKVQVVGHIDGMGYGPLMLDRAVVEVKTMAEKSFKDFRYLGWESQSPLIEKYKWQASAYMLATSLPHVMVGWNKAKRGVEQEATIRIVREPFYTISDIANKLALAEEYIEKGLVPEGCKDFPCPYYYLHAPNESEVAFADIELETLMQSWLTWDQAEKAAKKAKDEHREKMLALTGDAVAAKVKGECGVTVETFWQEEKEYMVKQQGKWVTRVSGPRKGRNATGDR